MQRVVYVVVIVVVVFVAAGLLVPQTRFAILDGIGNAWDALVRDLRTSGASDA